jgi:hypothetical protein
VRRGARAVDRTGFEILCRDRAPVVVAAVITVAARTYRHPANAAGTAETAGNRPSGCRDNRHLSKTTVYKTGAPLGTMCRPHRTATASGEHRGQVQSGERHVEWGRKPSECQPSGVRISPGAPSREQADQPPNGLGAPFRPGCAGRHPLENSPETLDLMPFECQPSGRQSVRHIEPGVFPAVNVGSRLET